MQSSHTCPIGEHECSLLLAYHSPRRSVRGCTSLGPVVARGTGDRSRSFGGGSHLGARVRRRYTQRTSESRHRKPIHSMGYLKYASSTPALKCASRKPPALVPPTPENYWGRRADAAVAAKREHDLHNVARSRSQPALPTTHKAGGERRRLLLTRPPAPRAPSLDPSIGSGLVLDYMLNGRCERNSASSEVSVPHSNPILLLLQLLVPAAACRA